VTRRLKLGSRGFYKKRRKLLTFSLVNLTANFEEALLIGLSLGWCDSRICDAISQKRYEIELR